MYSGEWVDDRQHGQGEETWPDGTRFRGNFFCGKKEGYGEFFWTDGSSYSGEFLENRFHGQGVYRCAEGKQYEGNWYMNKMHGFGTFSWPDGRRYEGNYYEDQKTGHGIFYWPGGRVYEGFWKDGMQEGVGVTTTSRRYRRFARWSKGRSTKVLDELEYLREAREFETSVSKFYPSYKVDRVNSFYFKGLKRRVVWVAKDEDKVSDNEPSKRAKKLDVTVH